MIIREKRGCLGRRYGVVEIATIPTIYTHKEERK